MADIVLFVPKAEVCAKGNMADFIAAAHVMALLNCERTFPRTWLMGYKVPIVKIPGRRGIFARFKDVEKAFLAFLPIGFPVFDATSGLSFAKSLLPMSRDELHSVKRVSSLMVERLSGEMVNFYLGSGTAGSSTMFFRFGFTEPDGSPIKVTTHQFRHWMNTLAHRGGMSQLDIAKWSGRKDVRQNEAYDHMTSHELIEMARCMAKDDPRLFCQFGQLAMKSSVTRDEFMELEFSTAYSTEIGFCVHDFAMLPCQQHRDCLNCREHVCVKGEPGKTKRIREQFAVAEDQLRPVAADEGSPWRWSLRFWSLGGTS